MNFLRYGQQQYSVLSRLSPYVFSHPIWIHFIESNASYSPERVEKLLSTAQRYQQKGDFDCTCQILFICTVLQNRLNDRAASQANIKQVLTLAESHHSPEEAQWAIWGESALCAQWGRYQQAAEHLNRLEYGLSEENEWILANIVSVIRQTLQSQTDADISKRKRSLFFLQPDSVLERALDYLLRWGEPPQLIEATHNRAMSRHLRNDKLADAQTSRLISTRNWRSLWQLAKRIIKGEVRLAWIENNGFSPSTFAPTDRSNTVQPYTESVAPSSSSVHFSIHQARDDPFTVNSSPAQSKVILHTPPKEQPQKNPQPTKSLPNPNNLSVPDPVGQSQEILSPTVFPSSLERSVTFKAQDKLDGPIATESEIKIEKPLPTHPSSNATAAAQQSTLVDDSSTDGQVQRQEASGNDKAAFGLTEASTPISTRAEANPSLAIYCLGSFRVYQNDEAIEKWASNKAKSIFKYLITHREHPVNREILADLFWDEVDATSARKNLHQAIYQLRQTLQKHCSEFSHILLEDGCYHLNPNLTLWIDSDTFVAHYQNGQRLEREGRMGQAIAEYESAESLYQGDFLIEDLYEDWPIVQRESLKHAHLDILDRLSRYYFERDQMAICIAYCQKILAQDSCREDAQRRLMRCYLAQEQPHLALRQYHLCVEALKQELDVHPMPATVELYRQIQKSRVQSKGA